MPRHGRLLGAPPLILTEAFSSWCWRIAAQSRIPIRQVLTCIGVSAPSFWLDCGRIDADWKRVAIATMSGVDAIDPLRWASGSILATKEFACLTTVPLARRPIYRYCDECLRSDPIPYIRRLWRFAGAYICPDHGNILRDRCPKCRKYIDLSRHVGRAPGPIRRCSACGEDLCATSPAFLPDDLCCWVLAKQTELLRLVNASATNTTSEPYWYPTPASNTVIANDKGIIDPWCRANVHAMFSQIFAAYVDAHPSTMDREQAINELRAYLRFTNWPQDNESSSSFALGLDGINMFGKLAPKIATHLRSYQSIAESTYWWQFDRGVPFERRHAMKKRTLSAAFRWATSPDRGHG